jgi:hypothetical protein
MWIWKKICGFAICGLGHQRNLRISDLRTSKPQKFADLRFADQQEKICVPTFAILSSFVLLLQEYRFLFEHISINIKQPQNQLLF